MVKPLGSESIMYIIFFNTFLHVRPPVARGENQTKVHLVHK